MELDLLLARALEALRSALDLLDETVETSIHADELDVLEGEYNEIFDLFNREELDETID